MKGKTMRKREREGKSKIGIVCAKDRDRKR